MAKRLLVILPTFGHGGCEYNALTVALYFRRWWGDHVVFGLPTGPENEAISRVLNVMQFEVTRFDFDIRLDHDEPSFALNTTAAESYLISTKAEVVFINFPWFAYGFCIVAAARRCSIPTVVKIALVPEDAFFPGHILHAMGSQPNRLQRWFLNSEHGAKIVAAALDCDLGELLWFDVAPMGMKHLPRFGSFANKAGDIRKKHGISAKTVVFVFVGRLDEGKGAEVLLKAAGQICVDRDWRLVIAGDGALRPSLENEALRLNLSDKVHFLGFVSDTQQLHRQCDVFVLPTSMEGGLSQALIEACHQGLFIISTALPAISSRLGGVQGVELLKYGDIGGIADAMRVHVLNGPRDASDRVGLNIKAAVADLTLRSLLLNTRQVVEMVSPGAVKQDLMSMFVQKFDELRLLELPSSTFLMLSIRRASMLKWFASIFKSLRQGKDRAIPLDEEDKNRSLSFDPEWYMRANPDVAKSKMSAFQHYVDHGKAEGRSPLPLVIDLAVSNCLQIQPFRRNVLIIDATYPTPDRDSGSVDAVNFVKVFNNLGYNVVFASTSQYSCIYKEDEYLEAIKSLSGRAFIACSRTTRIANLQLFIQHIGWRFDLIFMSRFVAGGHYFEEIKSFCGASRTIFNTVDLHFLRERRQAYLEQDRRQIAESYEIEERERYLARLSDATIVVSSFEASTLRDAEPGARVFHVPLMREIPDAVVPEGDRRGIAFVGGFRHSPNYDAAQYFLEEIWPEIHEKLPDIPFFLVGADMPQILASRSDPGLIVMGHVDDLEGFFAKVKLSVAPLRYGAGAKGKVVTSLANGVPCVATKIATEGMGLREGDGILLADQPGDFTAKVISLCNDAALWHRVSVAGRAAVAAEFSLESGQSRMKQLIETIGGHR